MNTNQPSIINDVSKGSCHVCAYISKENIIQPKIQILYDSKGFLVLDLMVEKISIENGNRPIFIYESTDIYHRSLKSYLTEKKFIQIEVSPILYKKHCKNSLNYFKNQIKQILSYMCSFSMMLILRLGLQSMLIIMTYFNMIKLIKF